MPPSCRSKPKTPCRGPLMWFGGKGNLVGRLRPLIPPHRRYVEVFGGGAVLLFRKEPVEVEVYNDVDGDLVNFFRVLRHPRQFRAFYRRALLTPHSRPDYEFCRDTYQEVTDPVERAYRFFITARQAMSGKVSTTWSFSVTTSHRGMAGTASRWLSCLESLPAFYARMMRVQIEQDDFRKVIPRYDTPETFFYCDPPYHPATRRSGGYQHEMSPADHRDLVRLLLQVQGKVLLSGYAHPCYRPLEEAGWHRIDFPTACHAAVCSRRSGLQGEGSARRLQARLETVWFNYPPPRSR